MCKKIIAHRPEICKYIHSLFGVSVLACVLISGFPEEAFAETHEVYAKPATALFADSVKVYNVVDQMPEIDGGLEEVYKNIKYPPMALSSGVEGRVFVKFIVDTNGKVKDPVVLKDIGAGCGQAAVNGIKKVTFKPGKHQGQPVNVYYTLPINFQIK